MGVLDGKVAIVTGSGRGIGRGIALMFAKEGASVVVVDPGVGLDGSGGDAGPAQQVVNEITAAGGDAIASLHSVADTEAAQQIVESAFDRWGHLDILVNTAGILRDRMVFNMTREEWDAVIAVHLKGHYNMIKPASQIMRQQQYGRIINFSSVSGLVGNSGQFNYGAAKAGIAGMTRVLARDLGRMGVTCNAISPAADTRMTQSVPVSAQELRARAAIGDVAGSTPRLTRDPDDVAPMVTYLASDEAWNINGNVFYVGGGEVARAHHPVPMRIAYSSEMWSMAGLDDVVHNLLMKGIDNPAPPHEEIPVPGRDLPAQPLA